jgi:hypothetical protein
MPVHDGIAILAGMVPLIQEDEEVIPLHLAREWLEDEAGDYVRVIGFGLECADAQDREAYAMLAADLSYCIDACGRAVERGDAVPVRFRGLDNPRDRVDLAKKLARICATRPDHSTGDFERIYDALARQIVRLLDEPREAA